MELKKPSTLIKLYQIYSEIESGFYPDNKKLQRKLELSEKTIDRYIRYLRDFLYAPIKYDRNKKGYYLSQKWTFPFPKLTEGEIFSLLIFINLIHQFKGTPLEEPLKTLEEKIKLYLPQETNLNPHEIEMMLSVNLSPIKLKIDIKDVFEKIFYAIKERRRIFISYYNIEKNEITERKVDPYHIFNFEGVWYFCGFCHLRNEDRIFALDRIKKINILKEKFKLPENFDIKEYFSKAFRIYKGDTQKVRILFDSYQARWIKERIWHENQKIEELENGEIIFEIEGNIEEIKRWVLSYGRHAKILEPESLKEEIKKEIQEMFRVYK
jgi:predicted DNA-binding transcriptional regulator YafY